MSVVYGKKSSTLTTSNLMQYFDPSNYQSFTPGSTLIYDLSGNGRTGTLTNGAIYSDTPKPSIFFDGTNDYIAAGNFGSWPTQGTIQFWMNSIAIENYRNPFSTHYLGINAGYRIEQNSSGGMGFLIGNDAGTFAGVSIASSGLQTNTWYMITSSWNVSTSSVKGYLNSSTTGSLTSHTLWPTQMPSVSIGSGFNSSRYYRGYIGVSMIYNRQLTDSEVSGNFTFFRKRYGV